MLALSKTLLFVLFLLVALWILLIAGFNPYSSPPEKFRELKAFVHSAYYYPKSESLGENAVAIVITLNLAKNREFYFEGQDWNLKNTRYVYVKAENATSSVTAEVRYIWATLHEFCQMMTIFVTTPLIPNVKSISMVSDDGETEIPFTTPSAIQRDVVVCTSPLFVSEQWQNFLFAVHIYKKYGAFVNLYFVSAVKAYYDLLKEYEKAGYLKMQPWASVKFPNVSQFIANPHDQSEFRNQVASQNDCLLQYKESARFVTFLDLDDVLIPKLGPTFIAEFQAVLAQNKDLKLSYLTYHKQNHNIVTMRDGKKFSIKKMFGTLENVDERETGKIVVDTRNLNYTWIHYPFRIPPGYSKFEMTENAITHLKTIRWSDDENEFGNDTLLEPPYFNNTLEPLISLETIQEIDDDFQKMLKKPKIRKIMPKLPRTHPFTDLVVKCYTEKFYKWPKSADRVGFQRCPGPQLCSFDQHPDIKCMHVKASYRPMKPLYPITYYYATDVHVTSDIGCYPH